MIYIFNPNNNNKQINNKLKIQKIDFQIEDLLERIN